jgi:hypothetical protein
LVMGVSVMAMLRARYGAKDNGHTLLWQSDPTIKLPTALLGLSDRPQGYEQPGEQWWPSVGCAPLGEYWALWWTLPDSSAQRGGMVRSEVALWPLAEIGTLPDLLGVLEDLSGAPVAAARPERLSSLAEVVLNPGDSTPVVLGLEDWQGLLAGLWPRLSPSLRRQFSARVALTPPQSGQSVAEPWVYGAPSGRRLQWPGRQRVETAPLPASRAAQWLVGQADALLEEVLAAYGPNWPDLAALRRAARGAEGLQLLRRQSAALDVSQIIALLRTLVTLPETDATHALQQEAIARITVHLPVADYPALKSLANIHLSADMARPVVRSVVEWVGNRALTLALPDAGDLLSRAVKNDLEAWWRQGVCEALRLGFTQPFDIWSKQTLRWLGLPPAHPALDQLLPDDDATETGLLAAAKETALPDGELQACQAQCGRRNWSRLHAHILYKALTPEQQLPKQLAFPGDVKPGLAYLVDVLPGDIVLTQTLATPNVALLPLAAQRTCQEPKLLDKLDPRQAPWRSLWAAHIEAGGAHWPLGADQTQLARQLIDAVLDGVNADDLVRPLVDDLADAVLVHPQRAGIWSMLGIEAKDRLLTACAKSFIESLRSANQPEPEQLLSQSVLTQIQIGPRSALLIATVVNWSVVLDEWQFREWVRNIPGNEWTAEISGIFGRGVNQREWRQVAKDIYSLGKKSSAVAHGVHACFSLLGWWQQSVFSMYSGMSNSKTYPLQHDLVRRVAELGADLAPHEALSHWERAGGSRKYINDKIQPADQWHEIANRANNGGIEYGLSGLIQELLRSCPRNEDIQELARILQERRY